MKWFLSVFYNDYLANPAKQKEKMTEPDDIVFKRLIDFFSRTVWNESQRQEWKFFTDDVRCRRNAIHAYKNRVLGTHEEFCEAVVKYRMFLLDHERRVPYPDEEYEYPHDISKMK